MIVPIVREYDLLLSHVWTHICRKTTFMLMPADLRPAGHEVFRSHNRPLIFDPLASHSKRNESTCTHSHSGGHFLGMWATASASDWSTTVMWPFRLLHASRLAPQSIPEATESVENKRQIWQQRVLNVTGFALGPRWQRAPALEAPSASPRHATSTCAPMVRISPPCSRSNSTGNRRVIAAMRPLQEADKEWEQRCIGTHAPSTSSRMIFRPRGSTDTSTPPARPRPFLMSPGGSRKVVPDIRDRRHLPRKIWDEKRIPIVSTSDGSPLSQRWTRGLPRKPAGGRWGRCFALGTRIGRSLGIKSCAGA